MAETSEDYELYHYGVKGMRWGVRRDRDGGSMSRRDVKKTLRKETASRKERAGKKFDDAERKSQDVYDKEYEAARASGQGRLKAHKTAAKSKSYQDSAKKVVKSEERSIKEAKRADSDFEFALQKDKISRAQARETMKSQAKNYRETTGRGQFTAKNILTSGVSTIGYHDAIGSGATKGQAAAAWFLTGPAAGTVYRRVATR